MAQEEDDPIGDIDRAIARYYKSLNTAYDNLFKNHCEENGIEDRELLEQELEAGPDESVLPDFDEEFPLLENQQKLDENAKKKYIFNIIASCHKNPNQVFATEAGLPECMLYSFYILTIL